MIIISFVYERLRRVLESYPQASAAPITRSVYMKKNAGPVSGIILLISTENNRIFGESRCGPLPFEGYRQLEMTVPGYERACAALEVETLIGLLVCGNVIRGSGVSFADMGDGDD